MEDVVLLEVKRVQRFFFSQREIHHILAKAAKEPQRTWYGLTAETGLRAGELHGLLFATRNGTPWDQNLLLKRAFKPLLKALGIRVPRGNGFHAFRHANVALMSSFRGAAEIATTEAWSRGRRAGFESWIG